MKTRAAVVRGPGEAWEVTEVDLDEPKAHEVLVKVMACGLCHFDEHVREPLRTTNLSAEARAQRLVEAFRTLLPTVTALVEHHFRAVLLEVAQEHLEAVGEQAELEAARAEPNWGSVTTDTGP